MRNLFRDRLDFESEVSLLESIKRHYGINFNEFNVKKS